MKTKPCLLLILVLPLAAQAQTLREQVNDYAQTLPAENPIRQAWGKGYIQPMRDHLLEPTQTQVVSQTNITARAARLISLEQNWLGILATNNIPATAKYETIAATLDSKLDAAIANNNVSAAFRLCQGGIKLSALSILIVNEGGDLQSITAATQSTNIVTSTVVTERRWESLGLQLPPSNKDLE